MAKKGPTMVDEWLDRQKKEVFTNLGASRAQDATRHGRLCLFGALGQSYNVASAKGNLGKGPREIVEMGNTKQGKGAGNPARNIQILLHSGDPESKVVILLRYWASLLVASASAFENAVGEVKELGFRPNKTLFLVALRAKLVRKSLWERKIELYNKWGWSEEIVVCEEPAVAFVLQFLLSKGLVKDVNWVAAFIVSEMVFLQKFVVCFEKEASQFLKLYEENRDIPS
ncbi:transcription termination factor [Spatholobus suberectus]|nr:transcription termination factor [Spatholobus suberectus]